MSYEQPELFSADARSVDELTKPTWGYQDSNLNFRSYQMPARHGLGSFADNDEPQMSTVVECVLPASSGITQKVRDFYGREKIRPFTIYGSENDKDVGEVVNAWLKKKDYSGSGKLNSETEAGIWILKNSPELNAARRYWEAVILQNRIKDMEFSLEQLKLDLKTANGVLQIRIKEAAEDRQLTSEEKELLLKELG